MKKLVMLAIFFIAIGGVAATPISVDKDVLVTGDWKWDGTWQSGNFPTAEFNFEASSLLSTVSGYKEIEQLGTPWKYSLDMNLGANSAGNTHSLFKAITLNDPVTTPATGGYTQFGFFSGSMGDFSTTSLAITGEGVVSVELSTVFDTAFSQWNHVRVNE